MPLVMPSDDKARCCSAVPGDNVASHDAERAFSNDVEATDDAITKQVKRHLSRDKDLQHESIDVKVNAGVVSLTGETNTFGSSAKASYIAWKTPGVKSVKNDITVKEQAS